MQPNTTSLMIDSRQVFLKHLDKIYCSKSNTKKYQIIDYYISFGHLVLPHIKDKPFCMIHFPHGVGGKNFYQKRCPADAPSWLKTVQINGSEGSIDWCLINDISSIVYMANRSVVEMHSWFSCISDLSSPNVAVIDIDPFDASGFKDAKTIAKAFGVLLSELKLYAVPKLSGGNGIHIYIPIKPVPFATVLEFLSKLCKIVESAYPTLATTIRPIEKRKNRVYLDAVQNAHGKTICAPYSLRARENLPVAVPVLWQELDDKALTPQTYTIKNISKRIQSTGDLFDGFYQKKQILPTL